MDIATKLQVSAAVAEGDGATGWVLALTNVCHWLVGLYHDDAQQEIFGADPAARVCGVLTPSIETRREEGGLVISGRWPWASGSLHATWGLVGALDKDAAGSVTEHLLALIPMSELAVEDRWFWPAQAPKRAISYTSFERQTDSVAFQLEVAKAEMKVDTAHLHAFRAAGEIDAVGIPVDPDAIAEAWRAGASGDELHRRAYAGEFAPDGQLDLRLPAGG